jgi:cation transport regulator ChaC
VWGVAYRIDPEKEEEVRAYLGELQSVLTSPVTSSPENIARKYFIL